MSTKGKRRTLDAAVYSTHDVAVIAAILLAADRIQQAIYNTDATDGEWYTPEFTDEDAIAKARDLVAKVDAVGRIP